MKSFLDKANEYLFYALFFFVPLILWPRTSEVFEFNKMLFVYIVTILISAAWIGKWISQKKIEIRRTPLDLPILLFLLSQTLSTIFSIDTHTSIWGYYSRFHGGLASTISYIVLYYAFVTNIKPQTIRFVLYSIFGSAALVSIYGVLEHFGIDKNLWVQDVQNRVFSTLGQPNWLSAYLVALLPLPIFLAINNSPFPPLNLRGGTEGGVTKKFVGYLALTALFLSTIWFTKSQSGIGATAIILALITIYLISRKTKLIFLIIPLILGLVVYYKWPFVQKLSPFGVPNLTQLVQEDRATRHAGSDSMIIRQVVWQGARQLAKRHPLFGTGVETFAYSYYWVRSPLHNLLSEWEFLYNKAHNEFLNTLATTGFFGLASYLLLIGWTLIWWLRAIGVKWRGAPSDEAAVPLRGTRTSPGGGNLTESVAFALLLGYLSILITNYFGFSVVPVALFFFLFPAIILTISNDKTKYLSLSHNLNQELSFLILILATGYLLLIPLRQFRADLAYAKGKVYANSNYLKEGLEILEKAVGLSPGEPVFVAQLSEAQAIAALTLHQQLASLTASDPAKLKVQGEKMRADFINAAAKNSARAVELNKYHTNFYKSKAKVELYLGAIKPEYNLAALQTLIELTNLSPTDPKIAFNIGVLYDSLGQKEKAKEYLQKALDLKPDYDAVRTALEKI